MANAHAFGRRASAVQPRIRTQAISASPPQATPVEQRAAPETVSATPPPVPSTAPAFDAPAFSVEDELKQWKAERGFKIPWRQLALIASLCFGIASFELPDSVNNDVNWLLYGLMAISFYVGVSGWFKKRVDAAAERKLRDSSI